MSRPAASASRNSFTLHPPIRFKRIFTGFAIFFSAIIVVRLCWGYIASSRLSAEIDAIHARDEPILIEDFADPVIPPQDNAAWYLRQAGQLQVEPPLSINQEHVDMYTHVSEKDFAQYRAFIAVNQTAVRFVRQSRDHPQAAWGIHITKPLMDISLSELTPQRTISCLLHNYAYTLHREHDDAEAIEAIRDSLRQSNAVDQLVPLPITHLVASGMAWLASDDAADIAADLRIDTTSTATQPSGPASRVQVFSLIRELLAEHEYQLGLVRAYEGERLDTSSIFETLSGSGSPRWMRLLIQPMLDSDAATAMQNYSPVIHAAAEPSFPSAISKLPLSFKSYKIFGDLTPDFRRTFTIHFQVLTNRRAAAVSLAVRLWQFDHNMKYPANLSQLVPDYLPQIPLDPFAADGSILQYKLKPDGIPIIYSVGENGIDEGGSEQPIIKHTFGEYGRFDLADYIYPMEHPAVTVELSDKPKYPGPDFIPVPPGIPLTPAKR